MKTYPIDIYDGVRAQAQEAYLTFHDDYIYIEINYKTDDPLYETMAPQEVIQIKKLSIPNHTVSYKNLSRESHQKFTFHTKEGRHFSFTVQEDKIDHLLHTKLKEQQLFILAWLQSLNRSTLIALSICFIVAIGYLYTHSYKLIPIKQEIAIGNLIFSYIKRDIPVCKNTIIQQELDEMINILRDEDDLFPVKVIVLQSPVPNAFAVMGGQIGVFSGLLSQSQSREEIMGVLAHELGHVKYQHSLRNLIRAIGVSIAVSLFLGDLGGLEGIETLGELGSSFALFKYSRDFERIADQDAARRLNTNKISTIPLANFLERVDPKLPIDISWLSTHPKSIDRSNFLHSNNHYPNPTNHERWDQIKHLCNQ